MRSAKHRGSRRTFSTLLIFTAAVIAASGLVAVVDSEVVPTSAGTDVMVMAAGDIACPTTAAAYNGGEGTATQCRQKHTSDLVLGADAVLALGDEQYASGSLTQYKAVYDPTWGRMKSVTYPTPGDHEYQSGSAQGYFSYFGVPAYYSFDLGSWHIISLNSEMDHSAGSAQEQWLSGDLAATAQPCTAAFWGSPTFSSGVHGNNTSFRPFWDDLYAARADLVLAGDDHDYERFAKQAPDGTAAGDGIRQFVVGTGGRDLSGFRTIQPNSQARAKVFGVLQLRLGAGDYSWNYLTESGGTFSDSGTAACNPKGSTSLPTETQTPTATTGPTETATTTATPTTAPQTCLGTNATIVGTSAGETITGTSGRDVIAALGGNDTVDGGGGDDLICGAGGADQITGGDGNDRLNGGASSDTLTDLSGADVLDGSTGNDTLNAADSGIGDTVNGGSDADTCSADTGDKVSACETVR